MKYQWNPNAGGQEMFLEMARSEVGDFPTRMSMSRDEQRIIVCSTGSRSVEVLEELGLGRLGKFHTGDIYPLFAHELDHRSNSEVPSEVLDV